MVRATEGFRETTWYDAVVSFARMGVCVPL